MTGLGWPKPVLDDLAMHCRFTEPVHDVNCILVIPVTASRMVTVLHPHCSNGADISPDLDAFFCPDCGYNGRISGKFVYDMTRRIRGLSTRYLQ